MSKKKAPLATHRTDLLESNMTATKRLLLVEMIQAYRKGAVMLGREQWRLFFEQGGFDKNHDVNKVTFKAVIGNAARVQMCRYQVVGQLEGWVSNCANEYRSLVENSTLALRVKHMLHTINTRENWFARHDVGVNKWTKPKKKPKGQARPLKGSKKADDLSCRIVTSVKIPDDVRSLARRIMRQVMKRHRRPNLSRVSMRLDQRNGHISKPQKKSQNEKVAWWLRLSTMESGKKIWIPLLGYERHNTRKGKTTTGIQVNMNREGKITFGVVTDMAEEFEKSRVAYRGVGEVGLDFGINTLFATSDGQLLGVGWLERIKKLDILLQKIMTGQQKAGKKPNDSKRYRALVKRIRAQIENEVNRVLNKLVRERRPAELVLENLNFQHSNLSRRMNRLLHKCGRAAIKAKLADLEAKFGVASTEVNPAYTSQRCSCCGYVEKKNRNANRFECRWCGSKMHADINAAKNILDRRASPGSGMTRQALLDRLVREFRQRKVMSRAAWRRKIGGRGSSTYLCQGSLGMVEVTADPRLTNPYFR